MLFQVYRGSQDGYSPFENLYKAAGKTSGFSPGMKEVGSLFNAIFSFKHIKFQAKNKIESTGVLEVSKK